MILGLDHVGLATTDAATVGEFLAALGLRHTDSGSADAYGVSCDFWQLGEGEVAVEVVTPVRADSAVAQRLSGVGPGLYHLAFRVDSVVEELIRLRAAGFVPVDAEPCVGARPGMRVAFMYARRPAGLLVELVEYGATID